MWATGSFKQIFGRLSTDASAPRRLTACGAELFGTFCPVLGGCGSAVLAAGFPDVGIGLLGVSLAFGLTVARSLRAASSEHAYIGSSGGSKDC